MGTDPVGAIVESTIGAALLVLIESMAADRSPGDFDHVHVPDPTRVGAAARLAATLPAGRLIEAAVGASLQVSPYWEPSRTAAIVRHRAERTPIAEALAARPDVALWSAPGAAEQCWWTDGDWFADPGRLGEGLDELPWHWATHPQRCLLTTSPLPDPAAWTSFEDLVTGTWDMCFGPPARWRLAVDPTTPVYEVDGLEDWVALVRRYPRVVAREEGYGGNEFPHGRAREERRITAADPGQRFLRVRWRRFLTPDWSAVARDWAGVHLTWRGFLTAEGTISDLDDGDVTLLRGWGSERTAWLRPVIVSAEPLPLAADRIDRPRPASSDAWTPEGAKVWSFAGRGTDPPGSPPPPPRPTA